MSVERQAIIDVLHRAFAGMAWARAAWLGGSDATGRLDRFSDVDLVVAVEDERIEEAFALARRAVEGVSPIDLEFRLPMPSWHGHEQVFWRLRDADAHHMVDLVVMKRSTPCASRFLERERHGVPVVLFDREGFCARVELDQAGLAQKRRARLERLRVTFPMYQPLVTRAVERGQPTDAAYWYMQLTLLPTVEVLRMVHAPERFDFGMRYLGDDLPRSVYEEVAAIALPGSLGGVAACRVRAEALFDAAVKELDSRGA